MAEDTEDIGGISVSIGASHARLASDIAEANRMLDALEKRQVVVQIGGQVNAPKGAQAAAAGAVSPGAAAAGTTALEAKLDRLATALTSGNARSIQQARAQAEQVTINGVKVGGLSTLQSSLQKAIGGVDVEANVEPVNQQINELRVQTEKPIELNLDVKAVQAELQGVLATMREIAAEAGQIASSPATRVAGGARVRSSRAPVAALATPQLDRDALTPQQGAAGPTSSTIVGPGYQSNEEIERSRGAASLQRQQQQITQSRQVSLAAAAQRRRDILQSTAIDEQNATRTALRQSARTRQFAIDEEQQARQVEARRAAVTGSGRTSRTLASGLGALFGGTETRQFQAQVAAQQAARQLASAEKVIEPLDTRLRQLRESYNAATGPQQKFYENQIKNLQGNKQYQDALGNVTKAIKDDAAAQSDLAKISGPASVLRNITAITAGGLAFGAALKVVDFGLAALGPALGDAIDQASGFGAISNKITQGLAQQTLAAHGNVNAVLAQADAQANLSASASDALDSQLRLTTQVKAGATAAGTQGGLFRAASGGAGGTPQGLLGGYGGIGGGPLFAQQLGGGPGFAETIQSTFADFARETIQQGGGLRNGGTGPLPQGFPNPINSIFGGTDPLGLNNVKAATQEQRDAVVKISNDRTAYETNLNDAIKRGAVARGEETASLVRFGTITADQARELQGTNLPDELKKTANDSLEALYDSSGNLVKTFKQATDGLTQAAVGLSITPPEQLGRANLAAEQQRQREAAANLPAIQSQQAYQLPSQINAVGRNAGFAVGTQQPVQATLGALANPNLPVGTGIVPQDQKKLTAGLSEAQGLQKQLNTYYAQGQDIIENTYKPAILQNFGAAALQTFTQSLNVVEATGKQIASIQAGLSNEQAAYQVAQYNFQLFIAKRTLSDIGGLTDHNFGAGESYLGVLERQNLLLGRQAQQLQFGLSQRQLNFQTALAGFQAPGITPEERAARVAEAKIEVGYAQKQLDIQRQMFGNQVKIVDIGNLRQGADLARQIALLVQGRQVTLDTKVAEAKLLRLQQLQSQAVARAGTYLTAVDNVVAIAFNNIQQLEAAYGKAIIGITNTTLKQVGVYINGLSAELTSGFVGGSPTANNDVPSGGAHRHAASGLLGMTGGRTSIIAGEAQGEAVAILRSPHLLAGGLGGLSGGGSTVIVNFNGDIHTSSRADLQKVTDSVIIALGRKASNLGLRGLG